MSWNWQQSQCNRAKRNHVAVASQVPSSQSSQFVDLSSPFPDYPEDFLALLLVTRGLEDIAVDYLVQNEFVTSAAHLFLLPRPDIPALGAASVDKVVVRFDAELGDDVLRDKIARLQRAPVVQAVLAFVTAAYRLDLAGGWVEQDKKDDGSSGAVEATGVSPDCRWLALRRKYDSVPTGVLEQLAGLVAGSMQWPKAEKILTAAGVGPVRRFRSSCVTSVRNDAGFGCLDVMRVVGGGGLAAHNFGTDPRWKVNLHNFDVELYGFLFHDTFACGLLLGGQWRRNVNEDKFSFSSVPYGERGCRPYTVGDHQPWFSPRLRQSTALLLLLLADLQPGERLLDCMGGSATIAIEAAVHFTGVSAITSDNNPVVTSSAVKNCILARPHLASGSSVQAEDWDACNLTKLADSSIDRIVTDMPFGNKCRWKVAESLPLMLSEAARVLRPGGKAVLLMKGYRRIEALLEGTVEEGAEFADDAMDTSQCMNPSELLEADAPLACEDDVVSEDMQATQESNCDIPPRIVDFSCLVAVHRRPVAIGGYLCYALGLEKKQQ